MEHDDTNASESEDTSIEAAILGAIEDHEGTDATAEAEPQADLDVQGDKGAPDEGKGDKKPSDLSEAARLLAQSKRKGKRRQVVEIKPGAESAPAEPREQRVKGEQPEAPAPDDSYQPPQRWPLADKEKFNGLPPEAKRNVLDFWQNMEYHFTKGSQEIAAQRTRYEQLDRIVGHYVPKWNLKGMTDVQAVAELCATQDLFNRDPLHAADLVLRKSGISLEQLAEYRQSGNAQTAQAPNKPLTREEMLAILQEREGLQRQQWAETQQQQSLQPVLAEVTQLQNERSQDGRYLYPELHDATTIQGLRPLVDATRTTQPGISWSEALKRAIQTHRLLTGQTTGSQFGPSQRPTPNEIAKVRGASVSVRGRGNVAMPSMTEAKPGERIEDSIAAAMAGNGIPY